MKQNKIPKVIHYCWFGGRELPESAKKCIESWRKNFPGYEIKEWNEKNFDIDTIKYTSDASKMKKWAFVSDYARFWILYNYGGIYFDTDVESISNIEDILEKGPFLGQEISKNGILVNPGLGMGAYPRMDFYKKMLDNYQKLTLKDSTGKIKTIVEITTDALKKEGLKDVQEIQEIDGIYIYPSDYFCPLDYQTGTINITNNTKTVHLYDASWFTESDRRILKVEQRIRKRLIPPFDKITCKIYRYSFRTIEYIKKGIFLKKLKKKLSKKEKSNG